MSTRKFAGLSIVPDIAPTGEMLICEERAAQSLLKKLEEFVDDLGDEYLNSESWSIFNAWQDLYFDRNSDSMSLYRAWQFFQWRPDPSTVKHNLFNESTQTIAAAYLVAHRTDLSREELKHIESLKDLRLDLYEIVSVQENYITLYGSIHQSKVVVFSSDINLESRVGEYVFASIIAVDSLHSVFVAKSRTLPRICEAEINEFRQFVKRCEGIPREFTHFESDFLNLYYDLNCEYA